MMTEWEAIEKRISCRAYEDAPIPADILKLLSDKIDELNRESGLNFQLITTFDGSRPDIKLPKAMFAGRITTYAALAAGKDDLSAEKAGYYGEKLVLYATQLGLGTCWVGGTYEKDSMTADAGDGVVWDIVPMGIPTAKMPMKQQLIRKAIRAKDRKLSDFAQEGGAKYEEMPEWVKKGIEAIRKGPSAVNLQPVNVLYKDGAASIVIRRKGGLVYNDMGIAKYQFEVAAREMGVNGHWEFGDGAPFVTEN